jgi:hypothetical protein
MHKRKMMEQEQKIYKTFKSGAYHSFFSRFEEALMQTKDWEMPVIRCEVAGNWVFRVAKDGGNWHQEYADGRQRDVTQRVRRMIQEGVKKAGRK